MMHLLKNKFVTDPPNCQRLPSSGASIIKPTKLLNHIDLQHHRSVTQIPERRLYTYRYIYILHIFTFSRAGKLKSSPKRGIMPASWLNHLCGHVWLLLPHLHPNSNLHFVPKMSNLKKCRKLSVNIYEMWSLFFQK
jgi:hypothetical protein